MDARKLAALGAMNRRGSGGNILSWDSAEEGQGTPSPADVRAGQPVGAEGRSRRGSRPSARDGAGDAAALMTEHDTMVQIMQARMINMKVMRAMWEQGDVHGALLYASRLKDLSVWVDLLGAMGPRSVQPAPARPSLSLEVAEVLLPVLRALLRSRYEDYVLTALNTGDSLVRALAPTLQSASSWAPDMQTASTRSQCERCLHELNLLQPAVASLAALPPPAGPRAKRLAEALSALLAAVATAQDKGGRGGVRRG